MRNKEGNAIIKNMTETIIIKAVIITGINLTIVSITMIEMRKKVKGTTKTEEKTEGIMIKGKIITTEDPSTKTKKDKKKQTKRLKKSSTITSMSRKKTVPDVMITIGTEIITGTKTITKREDMKEIMKIGSVDSLTKGANITRIVNTIIGAEPRTGDKIGSMITTEANRATPKRSTTRKMTLSRT